MILKLSKRRYQKKLKKIKEDNIQKAYRHALNKEKKKFKKCKKIETSKLIAIYLFVILNLIIVYAMVSMWHFADLTYLGVLISDIAAQVVIYAIYCLKAYKAKKSEESMRFKRDKHFGESDACDEDLEMLDYSSDVLTE